MRNNPFRRVGHPWPAVCPVKPCGCEDSSSDKMLGTPLGCRESYQMLHGPTTTPSLPFSAVQICLVPRYQRPVRGAGPNWPPPAPLVIAKGTPKRAGVPTWVSRHGINIDNPHHEYEGQDGIHPGTHPFHPREYAMTRAMCQRGEMI